MAAAGLYGVILESHRRRLARLAERQGVERLKELYDRSQADVFRRLDALVRAGKGDTFSAHHYRMVLGQLQDGQHEIAKMLAGELGAVTRAAREESMEALVDNIKRLEKEFTGVEPDLRLEQAARFAGVVDQRQTSLMRMHEASMVGWGTELVGKMEQDLSTSMLEGDTVAQTIDKIRETAQTDWWRAERIARTETAWAFNSAHADGIQALQVDVPNLYQRWDEYVDDDTYEPLDDRVGVDSIAMHGQVALAGALFVMPPTSPDGREVPRSLVGQSWAFPPNRPNDRSVLSAWRPHWGVPGWRWEGRRVPIIR